MSIQKNYEQYKKIFENVDMDTNDYKKYLKSLKINEVVRKTLIFFSISILCLLLFADKGGGEMGAVIFAMVFFGGGWLLIILLHIKNKKTSSLDKIFFNEFLIKNIKIFYSIDELINLTYDKIEHIDVKIQNAKNANQATIELSYQGYNKGAEGIVLTNQFQSSHTSGSINKRGGDVKTSIIDSAEAILVKNLKEKTDIKDKNDIGYWHDLLGKGAITQDEYEAKKKELL